MYQNNIYINRYLCPEEKRQSLDQFSFLIGEMTYISHNLEYSMDVYKTFKDIKNNPYNFIIGNGGLGKSTYLKQVQDLLKNEHIPCLLIELKTLSDEIPLYNKINKFCVENENKPFYLLLDAIDEAIDCNIKNISSKITDTISQIHNSQIKVNTIITCRDNRIPQELIPNLKKIYQTDESYTFNLCRLTIDDAKVIAQNLGCNNIDDFINKIKEYNLGCFASSPITLKPLVKMYNNKELDQNSNNYDIYEKLMSYWCEESEYRKNKALNQEDNFKFLPSEDVLFVASKIAMELKILGKNEISYSNEPSSLYVGDLYNLSFNLSSGKDIVFSKELVDYTLTTKIFYKCNNKFFIEQQTYKDFLAARYLYEMNATEKDIINLLKIGQDFHPNFTESLAYLSMKEPKIFDVILKEIPERILLSSVYFSNKQQKEKLFKAYLKCVKKEIISFAFYMYGRAFFNKKLYYSGIEKLLTRYINSDDEDIKDTIIDIICDNRLQDFEPDLKKIIFDKATSLNIKVNAIQASKYCKYEKLLEEIAQSLKEFDEDIEKDNSDQLRGVLLNCLYPNFIDTKTILKYLKEPRQPHFFGQYSHFFRHYLIEAFNINDSEIFLDWLIENKDITEVVREYHIEEYSDTIKEIFEKISKNLNYSLITKYISLQLKEKHSYNISSKVIVDKILENNDFRKFFTLQLIERSNSIENFQYVLMNLPQNLITTYEIPEYMRMYLYENDSFKKELIASIINNTYGEFINNKLTDDIDDIYEQINSNSELMDKFGYYIQPIEIDPLTIEPVDKGAISAKKHYFRAIENNKSELTRQQKIKELNYIDRQIKDTLAVYNENNDLSKTISHIFQILNLEKESLHYTKRQSLLLNSYPRWQDVSDELKLQLIEIFKTFLIENSVSEQINIDNLIKENKYYISWNCLCILPILKTTDKECYDTILKAWSSVIVYFSSNSDEELNIKQELLLDLYSLDSSLIYKNIPAIVLNSSYSLPFNFLRGFDLFTDEYFYKWLLEFTKSNENKLSDYVIFEILQVIATHKYTPVETYIKNTVDALLTEREVKENKVKQFLHVLLYNYKDNAWSYIKNLIYKNKLSKDVLLFLFKDSSHAVVYTKNSMYKILSEKELIELYKWLVNKYPYVNKEERINGITHNIDVLKDFTTHIPDYFISEGKVEAYKKIKRSYLKNRKSYKNCYYRNLLNTKCNKLQNIKIEHAKLINLEKKHFNNKKGSLTVKIGKYIFGDNNTNTINENSNNKNINIGTKVFITVTIIILGVILFVFEIIDFSQLLQLIK